MIFGSPTLPSSHDHPAVNDVGFSYLRWSIPAALTREVFERYESCSRLLVDLRRIYPIAQDGNELGISFGAEPMMMAISFLSVSVMSATLPEYRWPSTYTTIEVAGRQY